ncbi:MAG: hypothetical protein ACM3S4_04795 [Burkholderiales bacterium]
MDTGRIIAICTACGGVILGIIGFFLKRTINQVDKLDASKASKEEVKELDGRVSEMSKTIGDIKTNYLTKEDFYREQAKTDRKLDDIIKILIDIKGAKGGSRCE